MNPSKLTWFQPLGFIGRAASGDVIEHGFRLDLTTELTHYTYDWGWGITLRILGFGFEYARIGC